MPRGGGGEGGGGAFQNPCGLILLVEICLRSMILEWTKHKYSTLCAVS